MSQMRWTTWLQLERRRCRPAKQAATSAPKLLVASLKEKVSRCVLAPLQHFCWLSLAPWCCFNLSFFLYAQCSAHCLSFLLFSAGLSGFQPSMGKGLTWSETSGKVNEQKRALRAQTLKGFLHKTQKSFSSHRCFQETKENTFSEVFLGDTLFWSG